MNAIEALQREIERALPGVETKLRRPRKKEGHWWLDATYDDHTVSVEWSPHRGFGVSTDDEQDGYGEGPDEVLPDREATAKRVIGLLSERAYTNPPYEVALRELRAVLGFTQEQLAKRLGVQQAAVSRLERRSDITLSSLRRYVEALGGQLEINVRTPDGERVQLLESGQRVKARAACAHVAAALAETDECSTAEPSYDHLALWLGELEDAARSQWNLCTHSKLRLEVTQKSALASADAGRARVSINRRAAGRLTREFLRVTSASDTLHSRDKSAESIVFHYLFGHEIGHLTRFDSHRSHTSFKPFLNQELQADMMAGWLAGHAGDGPAGGAVVAGLLGCRADACSHPAPEERLGAYLSGHEAGLQARSCSAVKICSIALRVADLKASRLFYDYLGLHFIPEKHGTEPMHYSCTIQGTVMELYPCSDPSTRSSGIRFGVKTQRQAIERLLASGLLKAPARVISSRARSDVYLVQDPDENVVEVEVAA